MTLRHDLLAFLGEFVGTTMFLCEFTGGMAWLEACSRIHWHSEKVLAFGGAKTALFTRSEVQKNGSAAILDNETVMYIALSFGLGLLVTAWVFYRVTGALFNPAITFALWLIGGLTAFRASLLVVAQILGGIAAAALIASLTPFGGIESLQNNLGVGTNVAQGFFIEALLTSTLVLTVLLLAAEKHKSTFLAPIGIGLVLLACHLFGIVWTGCGMNPARAFGPSVISGTFPSYHWIYWVGPIFGSLLAVGFYLLLKACDYTLVVAGQDDDHEDPESQRRAVGADLVRLAAGKVVVFHHKEEILSEKSDNIGCNETANVPVIPFDPTNAAVREAVQGGHATIVDLGMTTLQTGDEASNNGAVSAMLNRRGSAFSMRSQGQDVGAMLPPGTEASG
ncbi:hypothetical protein CBS101457_004345 [Exobasidium rhododendri]|nr:hypothetical protein CBS101457_004345 [Exobasidium rhododendri]